MFHVRFEPSVAPLLNAPVTSFAQITKLKAGKTGEDLAKDMGSLLGAQGVAGCHGASWGKKVEKSDEYAFLTGWDKVEVSDTRHMSKVSYAEPSLIRQDHAAARTGHPSVSEFISKLGEDVDEWSAKHVKLVSYKKKYL